MQKNQNAPNTNNVLTIVLVFSRIQINAFRVGCELVHFITFYIIFCNLIMYDAIQEKIRQCHTF